MDAAAYAARQEADGLATQAQADLPKLSLSARQGIGGADQSHPARLGQLLCGGPLESLLLVHPQLGREEDSEPPGESPPAPRLRVEAVEQRRAVRYPRALQRVPSGVSTDSQLRRPTPIGHITLAVKCAGTRSAGNPHATCDVAGTGHGVSGNPRATAPVPDPTTDSRE